MLSQEGVASVEGCLNGWLRFLDHGWLRFLNERAPRHPELRWVHPHRPAARDRSAICELPMVRMMPRGLRRGLRERRRRAERTADVSAEPLSRSGGSTVIEGEVCPSGPPIRVLGLRGVEGGYTQPTE